MNAYVILSHLHSINRWLVLLFLVLAIVSALMRRGSMNTAETAVTGSVLPKGALPAFITTHIQLLLGLILYFAATAGLGSVGSPYVVMDKEAWAGEGGEILRFYSVTHFSWMLAAVLVITIGYMVAKRSSTSAKSSFWILISYSIGLLLILINIPWPWRDLAGGWW